MSGPDKMGDPPKDITVDMQLVLTIKKLEKLICHQKRDHIYISCSVNNEITIS